MSATHRHFFTLLYRNLERKQPEVMCETLRPFVSVRRAPVDRQDFTVLRAKD
jgi:hypothetical protein